MCRVTFRPLAPPPPSTAFCSAAEEQQKRTSLSAILINAWFPSWIGHPGRPTAYSACGTRSLPVIFFRSECLSARPKINLSGQGQPSSYPLRTLSTVHFHDGPRSDRWMMTGRGGLQFWWACCVAVQCISERFSKSVCLSFFFLLRLRCRFVVAIDRRSSRKQLLLLFVSSVQVKVRHLPSSLPPSLEIAMKAGFSFF